MAIEIQRVPLGADVTGHVASLLRNAARSAEPFSPAPVVYIASNERRAKLVSRLAGEQYPEGTPDRVARELLTLMAPEIRLRSEIERDFDFFGALGSTLAELGEKRRTGRALVDELLIAWKRLAQTLSPSQRGDLDWLKELGRRGELLAGVVRHYLKRLAELGRHDPEDALWLAGECMNVKPALVIVDDLDHISPARAAFLRALSRNAARTLFILRSNRDALPFLTAPHEASQELMFESEGRVLPECEWESRVLADVCEAWIEDAKVAADIEVLRPANRSAEVRESARAIKRAYAGGMALSDICVAMPSTASYRELVEEVFAAAGIPYDAPFEIPLDETAPVAALLDLVCAARNGLTRNELLDALGSPFVPFGRSESEQREFRTDLDAVTRDAFIVGGRDIRKDWLTKLDAKGHSKWHDIREPLQAILDLLEPFVRRRSSGVGFIEALEGLLVGADTRRIVEGDRLQGDRGAPMRADALHAFEGLLREMREEFRRGGDPELSMGELVRALTEQAHTRNVRPPEISGERVRVLGLRELRGMNFKRLIVLGLTDHDLPLSEQETMFLPGSREEAVARLLNKQSARELCSPIDVAAQADYLFAHTLLAAGGALTLSFPSSEGDTPFVPATPLARLLRCMNLDVEALPASAGEDLPTSPGDFAARVAEVLNESDESDVQLSLDSPVLRSGLHGRCIELARTDLASPPGEFEGVVGESAELAGRFATSGDERHTFSPSQIDTYAECPMRFWARYVIRAKATEDPTLDTKPHAIGTLLHEVFERWVLLLRQELGQPVIEPDPTQRQPARLADVPGDARSAGLRLMTEAFEYACAQNPGEGPFWDGMKKLVASGLPGYPDDGLGGGLLVRFVDAELGRNAEGSAIRFVEFDFGKDNAPTPDRPDTVPGLIELEIPGGTIRLMGSVDRVDESPDGLEIIDYKTGGVKTAAEIRDGKAFQLPTYLAAISRIAGASPRGMTYLQVPPDGPIKNFDVTKFNRKDAYDVNQLVTERLPERLARMLGAVRHGVFLHTPFTSPDKACKWCDYAGSCGRRADVIAERAQRLSEEETPEVEHVYLPDKGEP